MEAACEDTSRGCERVVLFANTQMCPVDGSGLWGQKPWRKKQTLHSWWTDLWRQKRWWWWKLSICRNSIADDGLLIELACEDTAMGEKISLELLWNWLVETQARRRKLMIFCWSFVLRAAMRRIKTMFSIRYTCEERSRGAETYGHNFKIWHLVTPRCISADSMRTDWDALSGLLF